jgi:hypothetical protein
MERKLWTYYSSLSTKLDWIRRAHGCAFACGTISIRGWPELKFEWRKMNSMLELDRPGRVPCASAAGGSRFTQVRAISVGA